MVYASHILEHLGYQTDLPHVLGEVARILKPGGRLFASVPDLETLCRLFLHEELDMQARFQVMRMMFGGQVDAYDFHFVGLNDELLASFLQDARFSQVYRVPDFGIFDDTSKMRFGGIPISLNMVAVR
jgi:predicted SAM-dependent methyltransferase